MSMDRMKCGCLSHFDLAENNPCEYDALLTRYKELGEKAVQREAALNARVAELRGRVESLEDTLATTVTLAHASKEIAIHVEAAAAARRALKAHGCAGPGCPSCA